jgi:hypothetical protein
VDLDAETDRLYGLPLDEFVSERDQAAKRLRGDDEREAAAAIKALRKPTLGAWAINQATRHRTQERDELLAAGERLRIAHETLLAGGDAGALREATRAERALVAALAETAATIATEGGKGGSALVERLRSTLHAAATDDELREELAAGRVVREREASGLGMLGETALPARGSQRRGAASARGDGSATTAGGGAGSDAKRAGGARKGRAKAGRRGAGADAQDDGAKTGRDAGADAREGGAKTGRGAAAKLDRAAAKRTREEAAEREREAERRELAEQLAAAEGELAEARSDLDSAESARDDAGDRLEAAREALEQARSAESDARRVAREHAKEVARLQRLVERLRAKAPRD